MGECCLHNMLGDRGTLNQCMVADLMPVSLAGPDIESHMESRGSDYVIAWTPCMDRDGLREE